MRASPGAAKGAVSPGPPWVRVFMVLRFAHLRGDKEIIPRLTNTCWLYVEKCWIIFARLLSLFGVRVPLYQSVNDPRLKRGGLLARCP